LNGVIGPHYADATLLLILANQFVPTHSLKYLWVYICLHTITRHKGNSSIHVSKSLDSLFGRNLITLVVYPMHDPLFYTHYSSNNVVCKSESTSTHVYKINVESEINVLHNKSPSRSCNECDL
jgi:hypothetical protein